MHHHFHASFNCHSRFNEEQLILDCLNSIKESISANKKPGFTHEIIVVDNNSTDKTAQYRRSCGHGRLVTIYRADSLLNPGMVTDILHMIESGQYVGCGSVMHMSDLPWWGNAAMRLWTMLSVTFRWASGALVVCRSSAFRDAGGFNQEMSAADEIDLSKLLKK